MGVEASMSVMKNLAAYKNYIIFLIFPQTAATANNVSSMQTKSLGSPPQARGLMHMLAAH